jgi:undecaprenyl-diphosphatase
MKKTERTILLSGIGLMGAFAIWTLLIQRMDVQTAGPNGTRVGFATFNMWVHELTGVHMSLYTVTDWLGLVPIFICLCFGALGCVQLVSRRSLLRVDLDLILLGAYYVLVIGAYLVFEMIPINYRPILINGAMEASYPSSTTLLVLSVMPTLLFQVNRRTKRQTVRRMTAAFVVLFSAFMVIGRLVAGVHWLTDIVGSVLLSAGLYSLYRAAVLAMVHK